MHAAKKIIGMKIRDLKKGRKRISKHLVIDLRIDIQDERQYSTDDILVHPIHEQNSADNILSTPIPDQKIPDA